MDAWDLAPDSIDFSGKIRDVIEFNGEYASVGLMVPGTDAKVEPLHPLAVAGHEILRAIFDALAPPPNCAIPKSESATADSRHPYRDIVAISRVCKIWRQCALENSHLWASIVIPGSGHELDLGSGSEPWWTWAHVLMARSKKAPLFVCLDLKFVGEGDHCEAIQRCLPRIKRLCIHGSELSKNPILDVLKANSAPTLETLSLDLTSTNKLVRCDFWPEDLFCNEAPRLRQLKVKPGIVVIPSSIGVLTHYNVLHRGNERTSPNCRYDLYAQLSLMSSKLEVLEIECDTHTRLDWEQRPPIRFLQLHKFFIKDSFQNCAQVLAKMVVPAGCTIEIVLQDRGPADASDRVFELASRCRVDDI